MNVEKLLYVLRSLVDDEEHGEIQTILTGVSTALSALVSSPTSESAQTALVKQIEELDEVVKELEPTYSPAFRKRMDELGVTRFFTASLVSDVRRIIVENSMTPAVAQREIETLLKSRREVLDHLDRTYAGLVALGFEEDSMKAGEAEIGFQIPRGIFNNELGGFARELQELRQIIRAFSELAGNAGEPIELRQLSTSDPIVFVALGLGTVKLLGSAVTWALATWKSVEDIRKIRVETAKLATDDTTQVILGQFDDLIDAKVKTSVADEAKRLVAPEPGEVGRKNEQVTHLEKSLHALLARVERGMTVEIKMLPPPADDDAEAEPEARKDYEEVQAIRNQLIFPQPSGSPVLALTSMSASDANDQAQAAA